MQRRDNPYTPGAGRKPPHLAGHDRDLEDFTSLIEIVSGGGADRSLIYSGLRGVGKTVLLMEMDILAAEAGWATTDVQEVGSQPDFPSTFAQMASRLLREMSRKHQIKERVERALGVVKAFSILTAGGVQLKLDVEAARGVADSGDPEQDLVDLLHEIGETARSAGSGALFLVDEMHNLDASSLAAVCMAFQAVSRASLPVALVGAALPDLQVRLMRAKPYADRLFEYRELGRLRDVEARVALVKPASALGVEFNKNAAMEVVRLAAGYPYFLQEYGRELWNAAERSPITSSDVDRRPPARRPGAARGPAGRGPPAGYHPRSHPRSGSLVRLLTTRGGRVRPAVAHDPLCDRSPWRRLSAIRYSPVVRRLRAPWSGAVGPAGRKAGLHRRDRRNAYRRVGDAAGVPLRPGGCQRAVHLPLPLVSGLGGHVGQPEACSTTPSTTTGANATTCTGSLSGGGGQQAEQLDGTQRQLAVLRVEKICSGPLVVRDDGFGQSRGLRPFSGHFRRGPTSCRRWPPRERACP